MNYWGIFFISYCLASTVFVMTFVGITEHKAEQKKIKIRKIKYAKVS